MRESLKMDDKIYMDVAVGANLDKELLTLIGEVRFKDTYYVLSHKIINLEEEAIKDALISKGWTPPIGGLNGN